MTIRLSICIPTYNRAAFIGETLESIINQATDDIEIVVSDNASTDNTEEVVRGYSEKFSRLIYIRQPENFGADANYMNVVANASGMYCWLFGSDDTMREGALQEILTTLQSEPAVVLSNRMVCNLRLKPAFVQKWLKGCPSPTLFDFSSNEEINRYFESATSLGAVFSFLSNIVVRRALWDSVPMDSQFMGTAYSHVYKIMVVLLKGEKLFYLPNWTVYCRLGNDSFVEHGFLKRILLDINGYYALAETLLKTRSDEKKLFLNILQREYPGFLKLVQISSLALNENVWPDVKLRFIRAGFSQVRLDRAERICSTWWFNTHLSNVVFQFSIRVINKLKR